jgi:hypothetical protein
MSEAEWQPESGKREEEAERQLPSRPVELEADLVDVEVVDDGRGNRPSGGGEAMGGPPDLMAALGEAARQRLKRWVFRTALWGGILGLFATEHGWARIALWVWAPFALLSLALNLFLIRLAKRGALKGGGIFFGGIGPR